MVVVDVVGMFVVVEGARVVVVVRLEGFEVVGEVVVVSEASLFVFLLLLWVLVFCVFDSSSFSALRFHHFLF